MTNCSFLRDMDMQETFETIVNPKSNDLKTGLNRFVIFKDPLNKVSANFQIETSEEARKKQGILVHRFTTGAGSSNVNYCLKNLSIRIPAQSNICIVGDENAGVNDFFLAIMKELIKADQGTMSVKGVACYLDMNNPKFIRDTIKENILLGRNFNKDMYLELIELVQLRLKKYPLKDRTVVVEGQKNIAENDVARILLARLLYSDADVVMMNNYFDKLPKERQVMTYDKIIMEYLAQKTVIYSTKNVHLIKKADRVLVMKDGMIVENDTYPNLMSNRASQLYKYLMTDPAGNTNLFKKVLDLFKVNFRKPDKALQPRAEDPEANGTLDSPTRGKQDLGKTLTMRSDPKSPVLPIVNLTIGENKKGAVAISADMADEGAGAVAVPGEHTSGKAGTSSVSEKDKRKNRRKVASTGEETNVNSLAKLQKNIMYNGGLSTKVVFIGQSSLAFYTFFFSLLITNISMGANILETCIWGHQVSFLDTYTEFLLAYDLLVIFYLAVVIIRDGVFTKMIVGNLNHLYNLMTNSLIDTQKEYLLLNPSTRIVYIMTKTIAKIDRDLIRSYYHYFDNSVTLLVILGALNYFLYIFMSIVTIFVIIIIMPAYSYYNVGCIKLSNFTTNHSSDLVEVFLSSFNFILPLRNHNISNYFSRKFREVSDTVMRAKIRLEDDILRWFHLRFMIYSTFLIVCILFIPIIVIQFLSGSFLWSEFQFKFVSASVPLLVPVLLNFANAMTSTSENMICVKSIIKYVLELSKNSEDATIIQQLAAMPVKKSKFVDMEEIQETNLTNFILKNHSKDKELQLSTNPMPVVPTPAPTRASIGPRSGLGNSELNRANTQVPGEEKKRVSANEPTKPLLMLQNVYYESKIAEQILKGINLKLYEAERLGIVCELGSGKDFLINLLMTLMQKSDIPEEGPSKYEITGVEVTLASAAELRKNMTYLYPNPSLLMGSVRDNIDPFKRYSDEEIMRTLHFLKMVRALQEYSGLFNCEDIEVFLAAKQNTVTLHEINLADLNQKIKSNPNASDKDEKKLKKNSKTMRAGAGRQGSNMSPGTPNGGPSKANMAADMKIRADSNIAKKGGGERKSKALDLLKDPSAAPRVDSQPNEEGEEEEDEFEEQNNVEDMQKNILATVSMTKLDLLFKQAIVDKAERKVKYKRCLKDIRRIFLGSNYSIESKEEEQLREFFEQQFINEYPIPMPIPERAKRLDDELEDFDMNYENHHIHFEDERNLMAALLKMEVGQNGKNLNEDCRKIIMMTKVYLDKPPIIVYDEEALFIHGVNRSFYIKQLFQNLRESGILGFIKDLSQIYNYSSVIILEKGEIIEQDPPLDLIDNKNSHLYRIVMRDDIRTLKQLENRLEIKVKKFERAKKRELMSIGKRKLKTGKESSAINTGENSELGDVADHNDMSLMYTPRPESSKATTLKATKSQLNMRSPNKNTTIVPFPLSNRDDEDEEGEDDDDEDFGDVERKSILKNPTSSRF